MDALVRWVEIINVSQIKRANITTKEKLDEGIRKDTDVKGLNKDMLLDRNEWRKIIHMIDMV